jgi:L-ascorbate metabolism protein UlaG (beta-lactamase superfamily)
VDIQYYGANCVSLIYKGTRIIVDDNLKALGAKAITKPEDVALFTGKHDEVQARITFDGPGEYEVSEISIVGIGARAHTDEEGIQTATMFKIVASDQSALVTGNIYPELNESQLESIGIVDVLVVPVGGNGFTVDPVGALKLIKAVEPKIVIPTHYADKTLKYPVPQQDLPAALKELGMEPKEAVSKLKLKPSEQSDVTQLIVLDRS